MKKRKIFGKVSLIMIFFALVASFVILYQIKLYNKSVLNMYADQQDQYIKIILNEIEQRNDDNLDANDFVSKMIGSLDSSDNKFWTLAKKDSLVYVKDVMETDEYRGFSISSYFVSESAKSFLNGLEKDKVKHRFITQSGKKYIASGALFECGGDKYKVCLLTNEGFVLDNNDFIQAEIVIMLGIVVLLLLLLIVSMSMAHRIDKKQAENDILEEKLENRNKNIEKLEEEMRLINEYDVKNTLFEERVIDRFMEKLEQKGVLSAYLAAVTFEDSSAYNIFLQTVQWMLDKKVIRFVLKDVGGKKAVLLIFWDCNSDEVQNAAQMFTGEKNTLLPVGNWKKSDESLKDYCSKYLAKIRENS